MKITIDVDCTPDEARKFMGLPEVAPMQEAMVRQMQEQMAAGLAGMDPAELMKAWMPTGVEGWQEMQKAFWSKMASQTKP